MKDRTVLNSPWYEHRMIVPLVMVLSAIMRIAMAFRPPIQLAVRPFQDDAYYVFTCARHLAMGHGLSVDGISPTNGVQPLIVFLYAPLFALAGADRWLGVQLAFCLLALIDVYNIYTLSRLIPELSRTPEPRTQLSTVIAVVIWGLSYSMIVHTVNGLETGLYSALILTAIRTYNRYIKQEEPGLAQSAWLGAVLGLTVLARIDAVFLTAAITFIELVRRRELLGRAVVSACGIGCTAVIVSLPWWVYNHVTFGSLMPISGQSEGIGNFLSLNVKSLIQSAGDILLLVAYTPWNGMTWALTVAYTGMLVLTIVLVARRKALKEAVRSRYDLRALLPLLVASVGLALYYNFFFAAPHFMSRYLQPLRILWLVVFSLSLPFAIRQFRDSKSPIRRVFASMLCAAAAVFTISRYSAAFTWTGYNPPFELAHWAEKLVPEKVGTTSSGIAGFTADNVVNLDGKVNFEALKARKRGALGAYTAANGINYIADEEAVVDSIRVQAARVGVEYTRVDSFGAYIVSKRLFGEK